MDQLFAAFGIDWRLLIINCINFGLLLAVLWYFLYGPLTRMLESRRARIEQSVLDADHARQEREGIAASRHALLAKAGAEADALLAQARTVALEKQQELIASGAASAAALLAEAEAQSAALKEQALRESKQEVAKLIVLGMERAALGK